MEKESEYKINDKDFKVFKDEVKKWLDYFGLKEYYVDIVINEKTTEEYEKTCATCWINYENSCAEIGLAPYFDKKPSQRQIKDYALHEVIELLLMPVRIIALRRDTRDDDVDRECHRIIRRIENIIFEKGLTKEK